MSISEQNFVAPSENETTADKTSSVWLVIFLLLICSPKINILSVGGFNAGIRVDDLIILLSATYFVHGAIKRGFLTISGVERSYISFIAWVAISILINQAAFSRGQILFPLRFLEYFTFFAIGAHLSRSGYTIQSLCATVLLVGSISMFLQVGGLLGGFTVNGYRADVSQRPMGFGSGPWEIGVVFNLCSAVVLAKMNNKFYAYSLVFLATFFVLVSGSRMALLGQLGVICLYPLLTGSLKNAVLQTIFGVSFIFAISFFLADSTVAQRSDLLFTANNYYLAQQAFNVQASEAPPSWASLGSVRGGDTFIDASWAMRIFKWGYAIKMWLLSVSNIVFGVGAGVFGNALDGGWLRILSETGVVGFSLFLLFLVRASKVSAVCGLCAISMAINMLFIDIYMAYKAMAVFLSVVGYEIGLARKLSKLTKWN